MRYASIKTVILIAGGILGLSLYFAACSGKKSNEPEEPKDYVVYFQDGGTFNTYYAFHPLTGTLDSFTLPPEHRWDMAVSADGKTLFIPEPTTVAVVDIESETVLDRLPYKANGGVAVSPDGQLLAVLGEDLHILKTSDFSVVFHDTDWVKQGRFGSNSKSFYCGSGGLVTPRAAYKVALDSGFTVTRRVFSDGNVSRIIPSHDETKWFLYLYAFRDLSWLEVYDVTSDSLIYREPLVPGIGDFELTPDERFLFYTNSAFQISGVPAPDSFYVFDIENNHRHAAIPGFVVNETGDTLPRSPGEMTITPDGRWLVMAGSGDGVGGLIAFDVNKMEIYWTSTLNLRVQVSSLTCQNSP